MSTNYAKAWNQRNPEKRRAIMASYNERNREKVREWNRDESRRRRLEALAQYGGTPPYCACCGETIIEFLGIDHINGGGTQHRVITGRGSNLYRWLKNQGYPSGFQVLCHNCNMAKGFYGHCPHQASEAN